MAYLSEVIRPPSFHEMREGAQIDALREWVPERWQNGDRDSIASIMMTLGDARDYHLYRKVGTESWAEYCERFLSSSTEAIDILIQGVRILQGLLPPGTPISEDAAADVGRKAAAEKARQDAEAIKAGGDRQSIEGRTIHDAVMNASAMNAPAQQGNSATYLLRRLARTSPETLAAYEAGGFTTVREAARAAGIPDPPERISLGDPETVAQRIIDTKGPDYARAVAEALSKPSRSSAAR